jgi:integrase
MKLTTANVDLPEGKDDLIHFDNSLTGFGLRLRRGSGGRVLKSWIIQYRQHGRGRRMLVGSAEKLTAAQARERAKKLLAKVELGEDPQQDKQERRDRDAHSLRSVVQDYFDHKAGSIKPRSLELLRFYLLDGPHLKPLLSTPIDKVTRGDVAARLLAASKTSGVPSAIALRSAASAMFTWAMQMGLVDSNPIVGAFKPDTPKSRDRILSDGELAAVWRGLADDDYAKVVKLLVLTGCRRAEIGGMRWSEFDLDRSAWTLPKERSKNGLAHTVPLTPSMLEIINSVPKREHFDILFGYRRGFTSWVQGKQALDARIGLPPWTHHDIRRSVATGMADIGIQPHIVEAVLNHQSGHKRGPAGIYNRSSYGSEVRAALALWDDHIRTLVKGGKRRVLAFDQPAANVGGPS